MRILLWSNRFELPYEHSYEAQSIPLLTFPPKRGIFRDPPGARFGGDPGGIGKKSSVRVDIFGSFLEQHFGWQRDIF